MGATAWASFERHHLVGLPRGPVPVTTVCAPPHDGRRRRAALGRISLLVLMCDREILSNTKQMCVHVCERDVS